MQNQERPHGEHEDRGRGCPLDIWNVFDMVKELQEAVQLKWIEYAQEVNQIEKNKGGWAVYVKPTGSVEGIELFCGCRRGPWVSVILGFFKDLCWLMLRINRRSQARAVS